MCVAAFFFVHIFLFNNRQNREMVQSIYFPKWKCRQFGWDSVEVETTIFCNMSLPNWFLFRRSLVFFVLEFRKLFSMHHFSSSFPFIGQPSISVRLSVCSRVVCLSLFITSQKLFLSTFILTSTCPFCFSDKKKVKTRRCRSFFFNFFFMHLLWLQYQNEECKQLIDTNINIHYGEYVIWPYAIHSLICIAFSVSFLFHNSFVLSSIVFFRMPLFAIWI